jgi:uroporphyrinogen-III synthase
MKLLVTRPAADSAELAALLEADGHAVVIDPMLEVRPLDAEVPPLDAVKALLFTSANGVRAFAAKSERRDLEIYAVGDRTAAAARQAGFLQVASADGDVAALARLVETDRKPEDGALLHVSGAVRAGNLAETLGAKGFTVQHAALYEAVPATALNDAATAAIDEGGLDGVLLFSPRTAKHFVELVTAAGLSDNAGKLHAWCLSRAVAEALAPLGLAELHVAPEPTQASLLKAIEAVADADSRKAAAATALLDALVPQPAPRRRWVWPAVGVLLLVLVVGGLAIGLSWQSGEPARPPRQVSEAPPPTPPSPTSPSPAPSSPPAAPPVPSLAPPAAPANDAALAALSQRVEAIEAALDAVKVEAGSVAPKAAITTLQGEVSDLARQLDTLASRPSIDPQQLQSLAGDSKRLAAGLAQLNDRLTPVEARVNQRATAIRNDRTLVLAAGQIRDALAGSGPFDAPVAVIRAVAPDDTGLDQALSVLEAHTKSGVPSRVRLAQDLAALPARLAEPAPLATDAGIWDRVTDKMGRLVRIRRVDDGSSGQPPGPDRLIANAEQSLEAGDLAGAMQDVRGLDAPAARSWLDAAQARLDCEQAAQAIETAAIKRLGTGSQAGDGE